ncbi:MAG TPA: 16S rRNA (guanine(527)-N(7))-methyltransferase RsmG [Paenirhodobacter sp.]
MSGKDVFLQTINVSRETIDRLEGYEQLLRKWNTAINLVSPQSLDQIWTRHFLDSAQIFQLAPAECCSWMDIGSGGGFPGLIIAILAAEVRPNLGITLVESDRRKSAFLATVARTLGLSVQVCAERIETLSPAHCDVLSARALAPLVDLLGFATRHLANDGICLFSKGARWQDELADARKTWSFSVDDYASVTDKNAVILKVREPKHV